MSKQDKKTSTPFYFQELAQKFCDKCLMDYDGLTYGACYWEGSMYVYDGRRYVELAEREVNHRIRRWLLDNEIPQNNQLIGNVAPIVQTLVHREKQKFDAMPFYCGQDPFPKPQNIIAYNNGLLDLERYVKDGQASLLDHTPLWVSRVCLPYDYNPNITCPNWEGFLAEVFKGADEQIDLLQEYIGYCLTQDTSLQKFLVMLGPGGAGKGTAWEVIRHLVGVDNAGSFSLYNFASQFGLCGLIGKSVAFCGEAEVRGNDKGRILETLKGITGQDLMPIERKHLTPMSAIIPARLIIACNETPRLFESTDALARRLLMLRFTQSFQGREDTTLRDKLLDELPGINNWALRGLSRLRANRRFTIPEVSREAINEVRRDNSPTLAFIQDCLIVENRLNPGSLVNVELTDKPLYSFKGDIEKCYGQWCCENGKDPMLTHGGNIGEQFWRNLKTNLPGLTSKAKTRGDNKVYYGIAVKDEQAYPPKPESDITSVRA